MESTFKDKAQTIKWLITFLIPIFVLLTPVNDMYTAEIRMFFAITLFSIIIMCFELLDTMIAGLFLMLFYVLSGISDWNTAFSGFCANTLYLVLGIFVMVEVLIETGAMRRISYLIMTKFGGSFKNVCIGMFVVGGVLNIISFGTCSFFIGAIAYGICATVNGGSKANAGIFLATMIGSAGVRACIYSPMYLAVLTAQADEYFGHTVIKYGDYLFSMWPYGVLMFLIILIIAKMFTPEQSVASKAHFVEEYHVMGKMSIGEKKAFAIVILIFLYFFTQRWHGMQQNWGFILFPWLLFMPGMDMANLDTLKRVNLRTLFFIAGCFGIGSVANQLGIGQLAASILMPYATMYGAWSFSAIVYASSVILNFFMTPYAIQSTMTLPFTELAQQTMLLTPQAVYYLMALGMDQVLFPYEYTDYLVIFAFGMVTMKDFMKVLGIKMALTTVFVMAVMVPYWMLLGLIA